MGSTGRHGHSNLVEQVDIITVSRTGFLISAYMIEEFDWSVDMAVKNENSMWKFNL